MTAAIVLSLIKLRHSFRDVNQVDLRAVPLNYTYGERMKERGADNPHNYTHRGLSVKHDSGGFTRHTVAPAADE